MTELRAAHEVPVIEQKGLTVRPADRSMLKRDLSFGRRRSSAPRAKAAASGRIVGLKIGASQLAAATVANNGAAEVVQLAREPLPDGIVVGGELREPLALAEALTGFFKRNRLPTKGVRLGIASNRIGVRAFDLPHVDDPKQLENAIRFRAQEALPIPVDQAVLDYHILDHRFGEVKPRVLLVVTYRELVDGFVGACRAAGLGLVGIDLEAFALLRALAAPRDPGETARGALVAVAVGHDRSTVAVSNGRSCEFTRVVDWGGARLTAAIVRALNLPPAEAVRVKHGLSLLSREAPAGLSQEQAGKALDAARKEIAALTRELVSSLRFYQDQPGSLEIGEIVLAGGTTEMPGLAQELERTIGVGVRVGDPLARVRVAKKIEHVEQIGSLAVAIGLGIED